MGVQQPVILLHSRFRGGVNQPIVAVAVDGFGIIAAVASVIRAGVIGVVGNGGRHTQSNRFSIRPQIAFHGLGEDAEAGLLTGAQAIQVPAQGCIHLAQAEVINRRPTPAGRYPAAAR